jgi:hypothetical protein
MPANLAASETCADVVELVLPSHWASYLMYGDSNSLKLDEISELAIINMIEKWSAQQGLDRCIAISGETFFSWHNDGPMKMGANCATFTFTKAH